MKLYFFILFLTLLLLLAGCGPNYLMNKEEVTRLHYVPSTETSTIYYNKTFTVSSAGEQAVETHSIIRVGENIRNIPELLTVYDGPMERLKTFQARVLHKNGSTETYGKGDLSSVALSNKYRIAEGALKILPIQEKISPGDYIETVEIHDAPLGQLGMKFSLSEVGSKAENIECLFTVPRTDSLRFLAVNGSFTPTIKVTEDQKTYCFSWPSFGGVKGSRFVFDKSDRSPGVLACREAGSQWRQFGDWYLSLIEPRLRGDEAVAAKARDITKGKTSPCDKLEAIAAYCQEQVRYEQVYLAHGEVIPNDAKLVFSRKYGDCKDYAVLMYAMAQAVGVKPQLALCQRGRGFDFHPEIAVEQFNHMLLHYADGGRDYWYDGTNRAGRPGMTADDLINATALVLEPSNSRLVKIGESPENLLSIAGNLRRVSSDLSGDLTLTLSGQYAIGFIAEAKLESVRDVNGTIIAWLRENLNSALIPQEVRWKAGEADFTITTHCTIPNGLIQIPPAVYVRFSTLFPSLLPDENLAKRLDEVFYFPGYGHVKVSIELPEFGDSSAAVPSGAAWSKTLEYHLPCGPFEKQEAETFVTAYDQAITAFATSHKISRKEQK